jgi:diguanylate cyclase (GGDEF)-like protein
MTAMAVRNRTGSGPAHARIKPGELVPIADRIQWMLGWRVMLTVAVMAAWCVCDVRRGAASTWFGLALAWPAGTALSILAPRLGRGVARAALTVSLLGDGILLGVVDWALGDRHQVVWFLICLQAVAVTLLASFRTGVRVAIWHCVIATLFIDAVQLGMVADATPGGSGADTPWLPFGVLWVCVISSALFAAMNERELRRRRHDSDVLRQFGLTAMKAPDAETMAAALAEFAYREMPARKAVVLIHVGGPLDEDPGQGIAALVDKSGTRHFTRPGPDTEPRPDSVIRRAVTTGPMLARRLNTGTDPWLAELLPGAVNIVVLPFTIDHVIGVLAVEMRVNRIERRVAETAMQATQHAATALDRVVLTEHIRLTAATDGLTRVANRKRFDEAFDDALRTAAAEGTDLALALIDIDHFKSFNDTYGHQTGDDVLKLVAAVVKQTAGPTDLVARYGGEEFAVIMPGRDAASAFAMAERIRHSMAAIKTVRTLTASLGVASSPVHGADAKTLIASADAALYRSKDNGRNRVTYAEHTDLPTVGATR